MWKQKNNLYQKYAGYYDILQWDKDYSSECDFLEKIFKKYSKKQVKSILDLGCGTGGHDLILSKRGYEITGIDLSPKLIETAKRKIVNKGMKINFILGDIRKTNLKKKFDVVILMFNVIGFQVRNKDLIAAFKTAYSHLKEKGLLIFDCWFGPAVLKQKPQNWFKVIKKGDERVIKFTTPFLDTLNHTVDLQYKIFKVSQDKILDEFDEKHKIRFYFPEEIKYLLEKENFQILEICPFKKLNKTPTIEDWNITVIALKT